jgi:hypothetical protein
MSRNFRTAHIYKFALYFVYLVALSSASAAAEIAEQPTWGLGDSWTYSRTLYATAASRSTERSEYTMVVSAKKQDFYTLSYSSLDSNGKSTEAPTYWSTATNFINWRGDGGKRQEYAWYRWPLEQGQTWEYLWLQPGMGETAWKAKVRGWETITVPAGTFRAIRIDLENSCYYQGVDGGVCRQEDIVWYSPMVRAKVRLERRTFSRAYQGSNTVEELISYSVR